MMLVEILWEVGQRPRSRLLAAVPRRFPPPDSARRASLRPSSYPKSND